MRLIVRSFLFVLLALSVASAEAQLARGRPYKLDRDPRREDNTGPRAFTWPCNFGNTWRPAWFGKFTYYRGELTDGRKASSGYDKATVRLGGDFRDLARRPKPVDVVIDLGSPCRVSAVRVGGVNFATLSKAPSDVRVEVSETDDRAFRPAEILSSDARAGAPKGPYRRVERVVTLRPVEARFVRVRLYNDAPDPAPALAVDEIEVLGERAVTPTDPAPRLVAPKTPWLPDPIEPISLEGARKLNLRVEWGWGPYHGKWDGRLSVKGGKVEKVAPFKFDTALFADASKLDVLLSQDANGCAWRSETGGATDGVLVTLTGDDSTVVTVTCEGRRFEVPLGRLLGRPWRAEEFHVGKDGGKIRFSVPWVFRDYPPIAKVKPIFPRTLLTRGGASQCLVVAPEGAAWRRLGEKVAGVIAATDPRGAKVRVVAVKGVMAAPIRLRDDVLKRYHLVLLGNLCNNRAMVPLYGRGHFFADDVFPGKGGYELRTHCDLFGYGRNVVTLAGVGPKEVGLAVEAFRKALKAERGGVYIDHVIKLKFTGMKHPTIDPDHFALGGGNKRNPMRGNLTTAKETLAAVRRDLPKADATRMRGLVRDAFGLARTWFYTGDPRVARCAHDAVMAVTPKLAAWPKKDRLFPGMAGVRGLVTNWDILEECGCFTDAERLQVTNALLTTCREVLFKAHRSNHSFWRMKGESVVYDNNHGTCWSKAAAEAGQYFRAYYDRPEADLWIWGVCAVNKPVAISHQQIEDAGGYGAIMPNDKWSEALRFGDSEYMDRGVARSHADWAMMSINGLGVISGYGDTVGFSAYNAYRIVGMTAWYYRDAKCRWFYDHMLQPVDKPGRNPMNRYNAIASVKQGLDVPKRVGAPEQRPDDLLGVRVLWPWRDSALGNRHGWSSSELTLDPKVCDDKSYFDKITFRSGWGPEASYLLLDGRRRGVHGQSDANSIIAFTANGRQWLFDNDSCTRNSVANHSSVSISSNGKSGDAGGEARLLGAADLGAFGLTRTRMPNPRGADWDRCVFWSRGRYALVIDRVLFRSKKANYLVRCNWKTMGQCKLTPRALEVEQKGKRFFLKTDGAATLRTRRLNHAQYGSWRSYPFIPSPKDAVATYLEQWRMGEFAPGDRIAFTTLFYSPDAKKPVHFEARRVGVGAALVTGGDGPALCVAPFAGKWKDDDAEAEAQLLVFTREAVGVLGATRVRVAGQTLLDSKHPVSRWIDLKDKRAALASLLQRMEKRAAAMAVATKKTAVGPEWRPLQPAASTKLPAAAVSVAFAGRKGGPGRVVAGLRDGSVVCLSDGLKPVWEAKAGKGPARVACADLDGDGADDVIAATSSDTVRAWRGDGKPLWTFRCIGDRKKPDRHPVQFVLAADLDKDGRPDVLVGKQSLYRLDASGKQRWRYLKIDLRKRRLVITQAALADFTGDGKLEIACATRFPAQLFILTSDLKPVFRKGRIDHGATDTCGQSADLGAFDMDGDGKAEIYNAVVFGACRHLPTGRADRAWKRNAGRAVCPARYGKKGMGLVIASETGEIMLVTQDWRNKWHRQLDAPIERLTSTAGAPGPPRIAAAMGTGHVAVLSAEGKPLARFSEGQARPTALRAGVLGGKAAFLLAREDGGLFLLRP